MFWYICFASRLDIIIKNYLQKIPAKELPACAFRAVAKLGENVLILTKVTQNFKKNQILAQFYLLFAETVGRGSSASSCYRCYDAGLC